MTLKEKLELVGWSCVAITSMIIIFSVTRSPYEIIEGVVNWVKSTKKRKDKKTIEGRHHIAEAGNGPDGENDTPVADHSGDDGAHEDVKAEAA